MRAFRFRGWCLVRVDDVDHFCDAARFLPTVNGAVEPSLDGAMGEAVMLADALHGVGALVTPERWRPHPEVKP